MISHESATMVLNGRSSPADLQAQSAALVLKLAPLLVLFWLYVKSMGGRGEFVISAVMALLIGVATVCLVMRRVTDGLTIIAYLAMLDPIFKKYADFLPYLTLSYMAILWALLLLAAVQAMPKVKAPLFFYGIYALVEVAGLLVMEDYGHARGVLVPSMALLAFTAVGLRIRLDEAQVRKVMNGILLGGLSLAGFIGYAYLSGELYSLEWEAESNMATSGGAGPVQVSFVLAVATFTCFWAGDKSRGAFRLVFFGIAGILSLLMIMTFSRGGMYILAGGLLLYYFGLRRPNKRTVVALLVAGGLYFLIQDYTMQVTEGVVADRFASVNTAGRSDLVQFGWDMFLEHPVFGVGTGNFYFVVPEYFGRMLGAHNELIRAAAEHGLLGLATWILFAIAAVWVAIRGYQGDVRALRLALFAVFVASTFHNGLKLLLQPMLVLLAFAAYGIAPGTRKVR